MSDHHVDPQTIEAIRDFYRDDGPGLGYRDAEKDVLTLLSALDASERALSEQREELTQSRAETEAADAGAEKKAREMEIVWQRMLGEKRRADDLVAELRSARASTLAPASAGPKGAIPMISPSDPPPHGRARDETTELIERLQMRCSNSLSGCAVSEQRKGVWCIECLAADALAALASREQELREERDDWRRRFGLVTSSGWQTAEQAEQSHQEAYRVQRATLRNQRDAERTRAEQAEAAQQRMRAALERVRWQRHLYGACGVTYRHCRGCDVGTRCATPHVGQKAQCGGHEDEPCSPSCFIEHALAQPAPEAAAPVQPPRYACQQDIIDAFKHAAARMSEAQIDTALRDPKLRAPVQPKKEGR